MKLKLEKEFAPISFDLMTPAEIVRKRKLEEDKARRAKELEEERVRKEKERKDKILKRKHKVSALSAIGVLLIISIVVVLALRNRPGKTADNAIPYQVNGVTFYMIPVHVPEEYEIISGGADMEFLTRDFNICETEITKGLWNAVMEEGYLPKRVANLPVTNVSFNEIERFIAKLSSITGIEFRLPSLSEYYITASYYNGVDAGNLDKYTWYSGNTSWPNPVKKKLPNSIGVYDIIGNALEYTNDYAGYYLNTDCSGNRIFFGGGFLNDGDVVLEQLSQQFSILNSDVSDSNSREDLGFRLVQGGSIAIYPKGYKPKWTRSFTPEEYRFLRDQIEWYYKYDNIPFPFSMSSRFDEAVAGLGYDVTQRQRVGQTPVVYQSARVKDSLVVEWGNGDNDYLILVFRKSPSGDWCFDNVIEGYTGDREVLFKY